MYMLDLYDIMFSVKALQQPSPQFNIYHHVSFSSSNNRSSSTNKLNHVHTNSNYARNFYIIRIPGYGTNYPTLTSISPHQLSKLLSTTTYGNTSPQIFYLIPSAVITSLVDAAIVMILD